MSIVGCFTWSADWMVRLNVQFQHQVYEHLVRTHTQTERRFFRFMIASKLSSFCYNIANKACGLQGYGFDQLK